MLTTGMLWFDDNGQRNLSAKIDLAVRHYEAKYGAQPNVCYVHAETDDAPTADEGGRIRIVPSRDILPHHFWLGVASSTTQ